jgi:2-keto-4-pentenoate hydratase/2-oxohepta-3-ene-1,7-dioic acid hydratase in catechol pathway
MRLVTFTENNTTRIGLLKDSGVIDLSQAAPSLPTDMLSFLEGGDDAMKAAQDASTLDAHFDSEAVRLECPIPTPPMILAIGLNYRAHAEESGADLPKVPLVFTKQQTCANGPFDDVYAPPESALLDYEGELGIVIGKRCRRVKKEDAESVIAGYTIVNDVSVRDWQARGAPASFTMGKSWDTHGPMGPAIVTKDEVGDPHSLQLLRHYRIHFNGVHTTTGDCHPNGYPKRSRGCHETTRLASRRRHRKNCNRQTRLYREPDHQRSDDLSHYTDRSASSRISNISSISALLTVKAGTKRIVLGLGALISNP